MFTENEANALITVEHLIANSRDSSLISEYKTAVNKIKAVLYSGTKERADLLSRRIAVSPTFPDTLLSDSLSRIQTALTAFKVLIITYQSDYKNETTERMVEPFALYYSIEESWLMIGFCRLRNDFRMFKLDRIKTLTVTEMTFSPHNLTLADYLDKKQKNFSTPDKQLS